MIELTGIDTLKLLSAEVSEDAVLDQRVFKVLLETSGIHGMVVANQLIAAACTINDEDEASDIAEVTNYKLKLTPTPTPLPLALVIMSPRDKRVCTYSSSPVSHSSLLTRC